MASLVLNGLYLGSIIALSCIGLTLIWGITELFNCSHGDQMSFGAFVAFMFAGLLSRWEIFQVKVAFFSFNVGLLLAFIPAIVFSIGLALLFDYLVYKPIRKAGGHFITGFIASLGMALLLRGVIYIIWGANFHFYTEGLRPTTSVLGINVRTDEFFILIVAWSMVGMVYWFMNKTKMGKALRALADDVDLARVSGINTERMIMWAWGIAATLIAISGILFGLKTQLRAEMGYLFIVPLFATIILGGKGSIAGALVGGLLIGFAQEISTAWILPTYKPAVAFIIMIIVLLVRPQGIFGRRSV